MSLQVDFLTEDHLRAYAEDVLDDELRDVVRQYLATDTAASRRVERYRDEAARDI